LGAYLVYHSATGTEPTAGKFLFDIEQGDFMGRPSRINIEITGKAGTVEEIRVGGPSVVIMRGELILSAQEGAI
jgi:predicted PhzF superfamily epimerase YddE/YHI9